MTALHSAVGLLSSCVSPSGATTTNAGFCGVRASLHISVSYLSIAPMLVMGIGALVILAVSAVLPKRQWPGLWPALTLIIGAVATIVAIGNWVDLSNYHSHAGATIGQQILYDHFTVFFEILIGSATVLGALLSDSYLQREGLDGPEAYALMILSGLGGMLMAGSAGLVMLFLGLEILSIALYVMSAYHRRRVQSGEAGLKYFILGSFSSAIFLYGAALLYGATGSTQFGEIGAFLASNALVHNGILLAGMALVIVGLGFKVAAVPFHFWTPDVYQGAPTPFTAYMAAVAKAGGFAGLLRVLNEALPSQEANWRPIIWVLAVLSLVVGSVLALVQKDLKRMLAYSSISQAGYVLVGVQAGNPAGTASTLFYLLTYVFIVMGSFAVISVIQEEGEVRNDLGAIRGLSRRSPRLAAAMLIFLLAQAGVPFTSGFLAKFYVISAVIQRGQYPLAVIAMLAAAIAAFFYLRVGLLMYLPVHGDGAVSPSGGGVGGIADGSGLGSSESPADPDALEPIDSAAVAGLEPTGAGLSPGPGAVAAAGGAAPVGASVAGTLEPPSDAKVEIPLTVSIALVVCVAFTIFAGVSNPVIDFARHATTLF